MRPHPVRRAAAPLLCLLAAACAHAARGPQPQVVAEPIVTDRPDFTESPFIVPTGMVQIENGYSAAREGPVRSQTFGEMLVRVPVAERAELRLGLNSYATAAVGRAREEGFEDPTLGLKVKLFTPAESAGRLVPHVALLATTAVPTSRDTFRESTVQPDAKLAADWSLTSRLGFAANAGLGSATSDHERFSQLLASASFAYDLAARAGVFAEYYGYTAAPGAGFANYFDGGLTYLVTPNVQLDVRTGVGANGSTPDRLWGVGLSTRW
jgi:hypothetical protein